MFAFWCQSRHRRHVHRHPEAKLKFTKADTDFAAELTASSTAYEWGVNGPYPNNKPFTIKQGQQATMTFTNPQHVSRRSGDGDDVRLPQLTLTGC